MKKNKEWLQKELIQMIGDTSIFYDLVTAERKNAYKDILKLVDQLDEPEKVVIPQFVADWWERDGDSVAMYGRLRVEKKHKFDLVSSFHDKGLGDYFSKVEDWIEENKSIFFDLVNGKPYEIEKEKEYRVILADGQFLIQITDNENEIWFNVGFLSYKKGTIKYEFTQAEIEAIDPRYMAFAEEVSND